MIQYHIAGICDADGIAGSSPFITQAHANVANDNIGAFLDLERMVPQGDAVTRRCLTRDGDVAAGQLKILFQLDCTANFKDDCPWAIGRIHTLTKRSGPRAIQVGDVIDVASASAFGDYETAFDQLETVYEKCDGEMPPPDFVEGAARDELADMVLDLMAVLLLLM